VAAKPRLFLLDAFGLIFRAYYGRARAAAPSMRTSAGRPTEAVYIFTNMLRRLLASHRPEYLAAVWEGEGPTFRDELYEQYKANRAETPDELLEQLPVIRRLLESMRLPVLIADRFEADDVIGALARQAKANGLEVYLVSSDKDLTQLVEDGIFMLDPMKDDLVYDPGKVEELLGVPPERIADFFALKGDAIDNIPGAPGIGDKGAKALVAQYGPVEEIIEHAAEVKRKTYRESLQNNREQILLSKKLATIDAGAPVELDLEALHAREPDHEALRDLFQELEFRSLLSELEVPEARIEAEKTVFDSPEAFEQWIAGSAGEAPEGKTLTLALDLAPAGELAGTGLAFTWDGKHVGVLPANLIAAAGPLLADPARPKCVHDVKSARRTLRRFGVELEGLADDSRIATFLAEPVRADYSLAKAAGFRLGLQLEPGVEFAAVATRRLAEAACRDIEKFGLRDVYETIELPLIPVLDRMEEAGVLIDSENLGKLSRRLEEEIARVSEEIYKLAGQTFNIASPKQLAKVLFDDLGLPKPTRRGKTRVYSTAQDVLEQLALTHEIAARVIEHRQISKLKGTYVDALPALIDAQTGRLHTTFDQTGAATGRLSSSNPNLQNIPIRSELGREIRSAFVSRPGWNLLAADYSQIELRILAHLSGDPVLLDAFRKNEDIHTRTAAEVFGVPPLMVGPEERRRAKAVNFGIVYGLSPFGLSQQLDIPQSDSRRYIDAYFERYAGVRRFIDKTIQTARETGETRTLFGRRRPIPDLGSRNPNQRGFAERTAVNSPIQGAAADLIKLAMIRVDRLLRQEGRRALMLLQVHDELLFELPEEETEAVAQMVKREMESVYELKAPLVAEVSGGKNWRDLKPV